MFYPLPIVIYILEIACVAVFLKTQRPATRVLVAVILVIATAGVFEWMIRND